MTAEQLRYRRNWLGLTQTEMAQRIGVGFRSYQRYEEKGCPDKLDGTIRAIRKKIKA